MYYWLSVLSEEELEKTFSEVEEIITENYNVKSTKVLLCSKKERKNKTRIYSFIVNY